MTLGHVNPVNSADAAASAAPRSAKRFPFIALLLVAAVIYFQWPMLKGLVYNATGIKAAKSNIAWRESYEAAAAEAAAHDKPVLVVFSASWCPPCNAMKHDVWPDKEVEQVVNDSYVPLYLDVDVPTTASIAQRYGVRSIPTLLIVDAEGNELRRASFLSRGAAVEFLRPDAA